MGQDQGCGNRGKYSAPSHIPILAQLPHLMQAGRRIASCRAKQLSMPETTKLPDETD